MRIIRDPGWKKFGSGILAKHPGSATLLPNNVAQQNRSKRVKMTYSPVVKSLVSSALDPALTASGSTAPVSSTASITTLKITNDELMYTITINHDVPWIRVPLI
jgi:hypothetical protein